MTKDFEGQLEWFTKKLLEIRLTKVKGFGLPIPFTLSEIRRCRAVTFNLVEQSLKEHLEDLVEEIKRFYIKNNIGSINDIKLEYSGNGNNPISVKIFGIDSDLLRAFLKGKLKSQTSLFDTRAGNALFYVGIDTGVVLSAAEQTIFAKLRSIKDSDEFLSYDDIFEIIARHKGTEQATFRAYNDTMEKQNSVARSTISYLLDRVTRSELLENREKEQIIKNKTGKGYQLVM